MGNDDPSAILASHVLRALRLVLGGGEGDGGGGGGGRPGMSASAAAAAMAEAEAVAVRGRVEELQRRKAAGELSAEEAAELAASDAKLSQLEATVAAAAQCDE